MPVTVLMTVGLSFCVNDIICQPTIGTLFLDEEYVDSDAYTLFYPNHQTQVYLIDNCGGLIHRWQLPENSFPGSKAVLDSLGNIYVAMSNPDFVDGPSFGAGGSGGVMEKYDWDGNLQWRHTIADSLKRQHHDFEVMPNGNILALAWRRHSLEELVANGFDTLSHFQRTLWSDALIEFNPGDGEVVWQWNAWDHLIQDFDSTALNFGVISESLGRIDINYVDFTFDRPDWLHSNSVAYSEERDQVVISVRNFHELWVIDHSTTTAEAATNSGGKSGRGGDIMYRWGNPDAYQDSLSPKILNYQHDASWYKDQESGETKLLVYNNWYAPNTSLGQLISPVFDTVTQAYQINPVTNSYLPDTYSQSFTHPDTIKGFSTAGSSIQILDNGNILMCAARQGRIFEVTQDGELAWEYLIPFRNGFALPQGSELVLSDNFNFEARKFPKSYVPKSAVVPEVLVTIEFGEEPSYCEVVSDVEEESSFNNFSISPNPILDQVLHLEIADHYLSSDYKITDINGEFILSGSINETKSIHLDNLISGVYVIYIENLGVRKFVLL